MRKRCCGTCKYCQLYGESGKWIRTYWLCTNVDCDLCGVEIDYEDSCNHYESKEGVKENV